MSRPRGNNFERFVKAKAMRDFLKKKSEDDIRRFKSSKIFRAIKILCIIIPLLNVVILIDSYIPGSVEDDELEESEMYRQVRTIGNTRSMSYTGTGTNSLYLQFTLKNHGPIEIRDDNTFALPKQDAAVKIEYTLIFGMPKTIELVESGTSHQVVNSINSRFNIFLFGLASVLSIALLVLAMRTDIYIITFSYMAASLNMLMLLKFLFYSGI